MTLRENAQFIDELRQRYRRLDGLLVKFRDRISADELWDVNLCVIALRRLLFGGIGDPNFASSTQPQRFNDMPPGPQLNNPVSERAESEVGGGSPAGAVSVNAWRRLRIVPMSVHDPADDQEVIP